MAASYFKEIAMMMHGFGDSSEPRVETVRLIESIVLHELRNLLYAAGEQADRRESSTILPEDILFLLRHNPPAVQRLLRYMKHKEAKKLIAMESRTEMPSEYVESVDAKKKKSYIEQFIESIDETGELMDINCFDQVKYERALRADKMSLLLNSSQYVDYFTARCASFVSKDMFSDNCNVFREWLVPSNELKLSNQCLDILSYLAHETVAQIVDLAFLVRNDTNKVSYEPLMSSSSGSFYNSVTLEVAGPVWEGQGALMPNEVREAVRRFNMPQVGRLMYPANSQTKTKFLSSI